MNVEDVSSHNKSGRSCAALHSLQEYLRFFKSNRNYQLYLISHSCLHVGDAMVKMASVLSIEVLAPGSGTNISWLVMCESLPQIVITPLGGILADRYDRRRLMVILDSISAVAVLGFIFAHRAGNLYCLYGATIFRNCIASLYAPVSTSITPMFVSGPEDLKRITVFNGTAWSTVQIIGGLSAGYLTASLGVEACYLFDSGTYLISAICIKFITGSFNAALDTSQKQHTIESIFEATSQKKSIRRSFLLRLIESLRCCLIPLWRLVIPTRNLVSYLYTCGFGMLIFMEATASMTWGSDDVLEVMYSEVKGDEDESARRLGILYAFGGFGSLIGPLLASLFTNGSQPHTIQLACIASFFLLIFGWVGISNAPSFEIICFFTVVRCAGGSTIYLNSTLLLQNLTKRIDMLGRVLASERVLSSLFQVIISYIAGRLEDNGFSKHDIALLSACVGGIFATFWSSYHLFGLGAARVYTHSKDSDNEILSLRRTSIDTIHSPVVLV